MSDAGRRCSQCRLYQSAESYSKRMLSMPAHKAKCRSCVTAGAQAEVAQAQDRVVAAAAAPEDSGRSALCSVCLQRLSGSAFSRTQLVQKTDATRRCLACVMAADSNASESLVTASTSVSLASAQHSAVPAVALPHPHVELARCQASKRLRRRLHSLCTEAGTSPPVLAFDRWVARCKLEREEAAASDSAAASEEPLLPVPALAPRAADGLVKDLCRSGVLTAPQAQAVVTKLAAVAERALASVAEARAEVAAAAEGGAGGTCGVGGVGGAGASAAAAIAADAAIAEQPSEIALSEIAISDRGNVLRLSRPGSPKPFVTVQRQHFEKLRYLHTRHHGAGGGTKGGSSGGGEGTPATSSFLRDVFCLLLRYESLGSHGYQAAVPASVFECLRARLGVGLECFASPLNSWADRFCRHAIPYEFL